VLGECALVTTSAVYDCSKLVDVQVLYGRLGGVCTNLGRTSWLSVLLLMSVLVVSYARDGGVAPTYRCNSDDYVIRSAHSIEEEACVKS
jgi:hypothetical protein